MVNGRRSMVNCHLEIPPHTKLEYPSLNNTGGSSPRAAVDTGVGSRFGEHGIRIQRVVNIEVRVDRISLIQPEDLAEAQIELVKPISEERVRVEYIHRFAGSSAGSAAQGRCDVGAGIDNTGL